jgi:hypothetical protein
MKKIIAWLIIVSALFLSTVSAFSQSLPNVAFPTSEAVADTYTVNITNYGSSYNDKVSLINFRTPNGGPATLNITPSGGSALGARPLRKFDGTDWVPLASGDIRGDSSLYFVHYSSNCGCLRIVPQGTGSGGGGSQDLQSVLDVGSEADITTPFRVETVISGKTMFIRADEDGIALSTSDGVTQMGIEINEAGIGLGGTGGSGVTVPTPAASDNSTKAATTAFVKTASPKEYGVACSDLTTALTTGTTKAYFRVPKAFTVTAVRASVLTAQSSGSILTIDINENGSSILSTKLTIDNSEKTSTTAATAAVISDTSLADDAEITIDIDQVGTAPVGLIIWIIGY